MGKKLTYEEAKKFIESLGYELISKEYIKNSQQLIFKDIDGYLYFSSLMNLKTNHIPDKFNISNPYTIQNIELWIKINQKPFKLISKIYNGNSKNLQWQCLENNCGEIFKATWNNIKAGKSCGFCAGRQVGLSNCLATKNPKLALEWHPTKNGDLTPYDVTQYNNKEVWWLCSKNPKHEWTSPISIRNSVPGCPFCSGKRPSEDYNLLVINPELCKEWDYIKNKKNPEDYCPNSGESVFWICEKNHSWKATISKRNHDRNCPHCCNHPLPSEEYNLLLDNPELCKEWNYEKNKNNPENYTPRSSKDVWWKCKECGHEWDASIKNRNKQKGTGCPECSKSKGEKRCKKVFISKNFIEILQDEYDKLVDKYINTYFIPQKTFDGLIGLGNGILSYDFYIPKYNLLIEYQGEFHDGTAYQQTEEEYIKQIEHDRRKKNYALVNGYNFLEIWYWEFDEIEEILTNYFNNLNSKSEVNII